MVGRGKPALHVVLDAQTTVHVGEHLRALREGLGLTQERAAVSAGLTRNTVARLEKSASSHTTPLGTLLALMEAYDAGTVEELLGVPPSRSLLQAWVAQGRPGLRPERTAARTHPRPIP